MRTQCLEFILNSVANSRKHGWTSTEHRPPHVFGQSIVGYHLHWVVVERRRRWVNEEGHDGGGLGGGKGWRLTNFWRWSNISSGNWPSKLSGGISKSECAWPNEKIVFWTSAIVWWRPLDSIPMNSGLKKASGVLHEENKRRERGEERRGERERVRERERERREKERERERERERLERLSNTWTVHWQQKSQSHQASHIL